MPTSAPIKYLVCVNNSEHALTALKFACARSKKRGSLINLLHVLEPADFQGILSVADKIRDERRAEAEAFMAPLAETVQQATGHTPTVILKEGAVEEQIIATLMEDPDVHMLLLGASSHANGRHSHITSLVKALGDKLFVPLLIIPGSLTDQQIGQLA